MADLDIDARAAALGIDWSQVDLGSIQLPPEDNFEIENDEAVYYDAQQEFDTGFDNVIVVDQLPVVGEERFARLEHVVRRIYIGVGVIKELWMPVDPDTNMTLGFCFIEFNTPEEAQKAKEKTCGHKMDKSHVLTGNMFDDFDRLMNVREEFEPPQTKPYVPLQKWFTDEKARDQLVIRSGSDTEVLWNDVRQKKPELVHKRPYWTESYVQWSPLGTYLVTLHKQGVAVWGGADTFNRLMRYNHTMVKLVDFSPGEKYLVTYHTQEQDACAKIFDVRSGRMMRDFKASADEFSSWPVFRWAGDKYFAKLSKNTVSVYETETFRLVDKKPMKVDNVEDISWSPTDSILSVFVPEQAGGNQPAKVSLVQIPSKVELRQKNLFSVSDCKMYWQSSGEYLAVKVDRYTKTKKSTYSGFELFRIKEKDIPIESLELDNKNDKIIAFAWEPKGHRFAVIHGDQPRPDVSFYSMKTSTVSKLATLKAKQANALFWSPTGKYILLAGLKGFNGQLEFFNVDDLETMATAEHFMATDIEWDPTGRYVATAVTSVHEMENGFSIWSFTGKLLYRVLKDHFFQLAWRPRPPSILSAEKEEEIARNLNKYSKKYEAEDQDVSLQLSEQDREKRKTLMEDWEKWVMNWKSLIEEEKLLRDGETSDEEEDEYEAKEVEFEDLLDVTEEIVFSD